MRGIVSLLSPGICTPPNSRPLAPWMVIRRTASRCCAAAGKLAQVAIIAEADKPAHTIEQARDGQPASGRLDPHEIEELPDRDAARAIGEVRRRPKARGDASAIEQQRREHGPGRGGLIEPIERGRELAERLTAGIAYAGDRLDMLEPAARRMLGRPQMIEDRRHIREGGREVGPAGNAHQAHGAPIDKDREQRQKILDLGPLEQTAQKQDRHAEPFEVLPDRRQLLVAGAEDRLVAIGVALAAKLLDRVGQGHLLLLSALHRAQLGLLTIGRRDPASRPLSASPARIVIAKPEKLATISGTER